MNTNKTLAFVLILAAVIFRIVNIEMGLWYNLALMGSVSLFSGALIKNKSLSFLVPLIAYLVSDIYIQFFTDKLGFYGISQVFTYLAMIFVVLLGSNMKNFKALNVVGYSISGSLLFWIVSNFGVWFGNLFTNLEPGLSLYATYVRALPFLGNDATAAFATEMFLGTFAGDLLGSVALFGTFALFSKSQTQSAIA